MKLYNTCVQASFDRAMSELEDFKWASEDESAIAWRTMIDHNATAGRGGHTCASVSSFTAGARKFKPSPKALAKAKKTAASASSSSTSTANNDNDATTTPEDGEGKGESNAPVGDDTGDNSSSSGDGNADFNINSSNRSGNDGRDNAESNSNNSSSSSSTTTNTATNSKHADGKHADSSSSIRVGLSGAKISLSEEERVLAQAGWDAIHEACNRLSNGDAVKFFDVQLGAAANGGELSQVQWIPRSSCCFMDAK